MWNDVKYEHGTLKVVAYDLLGKAVDEKLIKTSGEPAQLILQADRAVLQADGKDLAYVTVSVVDKDGNECPDVINTLLFNVKGAGVYRAACNGDATSLEQFHLPVMNLFSGKLVVLVQSKDVGGEITLEASGKGLKSGLLNLKAR